MLNESHQPTARAQVRRVLLITLVLNLIVAVGKIIVGSWSGAISITADGVHSLMDGTSNALALVANYIAAKPPDEQHPYGHRRFETIAALGIGILLLLTAWEIVTSALERLQTQEQPIFSPITFAVMLGTLGVNLFVSRYERREGQRLRSELLLADAANTGADVFVTISVLVSMALVSFGVTWADPIAALIIVVLIGRAAWQVLRQTGGVLVDRAPYSPAELAAYAEEVPAVERILRARSRGPSDAAYIDIDVEVAPQMTAGQSAAIADAIRAKLSEKLEGVAEVEVHFAPHAAGATDYALVARAAADALGLSTHEVRLSEDAGGKILDLHVEVPPGQTLQQAHAQVTQLERNLHNQLPELVEVVTHIEPALEKTGQSAQPANAGQLAENALLLLRRRYPAISWHDLRVTAYDGGYALTMHATLPPDMTVETAHELAESAEILVRAHMPSMRRVTIHTEPLEEASE